MAPVRSFPLAPMSRLIAVLTGGLLLVPVLFLAAAFAGARPLALAGVVLAALYALVWLGARPTRFDLAAGELRVVFPLWTRVVPLATVTAARLLPASGVRAELGAALRIGAGGLGGGFGWLWTSRRGLVEFYISRTDGMVIVDRSAGRPLLVTPAHPAQFAAAVESGR